MTDGERNPTADLLNLLSNFSQRWLWDAVRRHVDERKAWLKKSEHPRKRAASPADSGSEGEQVQLVSQSHAENYRLLVQQRAFEYQRVAELLWEVAPDLQDQLPTVDFLAVTAAESLEIADRLKVLDDAIRERCT
jgi:hypothetical protein